MSENKKISDLDKIIKLLPGISVCFLIALPSWFLGKVFPVVGSPVFSILLGIVCASIFAKPLAGNLVRNIKLSDGIKYTSKKLLKYSIIDVCRKL